MNLYGKFSLISVDSCAIWAAGGLGTPGLWWKEWGSGQSYSGREQGRTKDGDRGELYPNGRSSLALTTDLKAERILNYLFI